MPGNIGIPAEKGGRPQIDPLPEPGQKACVAGGLHPPETADYPGLRVGRGRADIPELREAGGDLADLITVWVLGSGAWGLAL